MLRSMSVTVHDNIHLCMVDSTALKTTTMPLECVRAFPKCKRSADSAEQP